MGKSILGGFCLGITTPASTAYGSLQAGGYSKFANDAATERTTRYAVAGTLARLAVYVASNDCAASTVRLRRNGANGNLTIAVGASATGWFEDLTNSDLVAAGDDIAYAFTVGAGAAGLAQRMVSGVFEATADTATITGTGELGAFLVASETDINPLIGAMVGAPVAVVEIELPACSISGLGARVGVNGRATATTVRLRKNGANANQVVTITASTTGWFEDVTNSDVFVANDRAALSVTTGTGTGMVGIYTVTTALVTTDGRGVLGAGSGNPTNIGPGVTGYSALVGLSHNHPTEAEDQTRIGATLLLRDMQLKVPTNTITAASTVTLRKNAVDTALTISVPASTTGSFSNATDAVAVVDGDLCSWKHVSGSTGSVIEFSYIGVVGVTPATGTLSGSLGTLEGSFTGKAIAAGALAGSLGTLGGSFTGKARATGAFAGSLGTLDGSFAGKAIVAAALSGSLGTLEGGFSATTLVRVALAGSLGTLGGGFSAEVLVRGTLSGSLGTLEGSFTDAVAAGPGVMELVAISRRLLLITSASRSITLHTGAQRRIILERRDD